ncbi:hypothetical protein LZF95_16245 [Algoriphagus sp. AGSA1]|uniref:hypothetical protein n=1 Tax=unclassified Algoriphagus TaxID=2641541 RepID=UPI0017838FA9|nr:MULTISPECIES: hypothetical protein [unclassified Algoriphagus]MCE7056234.1 hypothetical protein [Algoriphagus sp. AGSA1]
MSEEIQKFNQRAQFPDSVKPEETITFDFENYAAGQLPEDWSEYYAGSGSTEWKIVEDIGNKVMAQLYSDNPNNHFNVTVNNNITAQDMVLSVRLKGVTGNHDQGGGFVWRFSDKDNYYVVRANPLEDNVVLYKVENGKRTDLPLVGKGKTYGVDVEPLGNGWNTLKLVVKDDLFSVFLNNKELFTVQDNTFTEAGKVGFWTKADAVTYFDDFEIKKFD